MEKKSEQDQQAMEALREVHGVDPADLTWAVSDTHYVEILAPDGIDGVYHLFSLEDDDKPWSMPEGARRMQDAMAKLRASTHLQVGDRWAEIMWEPDGIPELHHRAVRRMEGDIAEWLLKIGIGPDRITASELLNKLQERLFPGKGSWYQKRLSLSAKLRLTGVAEVLRSFGHMIPDDVPAPSLDYMDALFPHRPGSWYVRIFDLNRLVMDRGQVTDHLLAVLSA